MQGTLELVAALSARVVMEQGLREPALELLAGIGSGRFGRQPQQVRVEADRCGQSEPRVATHGLGRPHRAKVGHSGLRAG